jgi:hypothetical protein
MVAHLDDAYCAGIFSLVDGDAYWLDDAYRLVW